MNWRELAASIFSDTPAPVLTKPTEGAFVSFVGMASGISEKFVPQSGAPTESISKRARFPFATDKLDELRELFGSGVRVAYARQGEEETGARLPDEHGVIPSRIERPTMPVDGCGCSACRPTKAALKYRQKEPGTPFGLNRYGQFSQKTAYRRDLELPWDAFVATMRRRPEPIVEDNGKQEPEIGGRGCTVLGRLDEE